MRLEVIKKIIKNKWFWITVCVALISFIFCFLYVYKEHNVYVYDYVGYQHRYNILATLFKTNWKYALKELIISISTLDYNYFPIIFLIPFNLIFGNSRVVYECSMVILYVVPIILMIIYYIYSHIYVKVKDKKINIIMLLFFTLLTLTYTRWWSPTLRGLPDIIGIIPMVILLFLFRNKTYIEKQKISYLILVGVLIYLPFLSRRWYAYSVVGIYLSWFIINLIEFIKLKENKKEAFLIAFKNFLISGLTTLVLALICQLPLIKTILISDYSNAYSAFQVPFVSHFINFYNEFGFVVILFSLFSLIYSFCKRINIKISLYCLLNIIFFSILFCSTQGMGVHHYLGISLYIYILFILGVVYIIDLVKNYKLKIITISVILIMSIINFISTFVFNKINIPFISQNNKYYHFKYENYDNLIKLKNDLSNLLSDNTSKFIVTGSTDTISDSLLDVIGDQNIKNGIVYNSIVDLRDGIKIDGLLARYVVVTTPEQYSMNRDGQQVMLYTNNLILNNEGIGKAYKKISDEYVLANGCVVYIYEKVRNFTEDELTEYLNYFIDLYPQWENEISDFDKALLLGSYEIGYQYGDFDIINNNNTIYFHPGITDTILRFNTKDFTEEIKLAAYIQGTMPENDETVGRVEVTVRADGNDLYTKEVIYTQKEKVELLIPVNKEIEIIVSSAYILNCDWLYIDVIDE